MEDKPRDERPLYVYEYSDFDDDFIPRETIYNLGYIHKLKDMIGELKENIKKQNTRNSKQRIANKNLQQQLDKYKEVIEEVREVINGHIQNEYAMCKAFDEIEFILDKAKENK